MAVPSEYRFLPWARRGLAAEIAAGAPVNRPKISVGVTVTGAAGAVDMRLYGPGDVLGIDTTLIVRTEPTPFTSGFEPNTFAAIDFDPPDFPWMFSPQRASGLRLSPWLVLVVVEQQPGVNLGPRPGTPLPVLEITAPASAATELPDLADSWAWAHGQAVVAQGAALTGAALRSDPNANVSRLVCPRRLRPSRSYIAAVVPATDVGVSRGLGGTPTADAAVGPAWKPGAARVTLPVYFHWEFSTGAEGDFESLARRLHPFACPATVGSVPMHVGVAMPGLAIGENDPERIVAMDGALRAPKAVSGTLADVPDALEAKLVEILDAGAQAIADGRARDAPVSPPIYGEWHVNRHRVSDGRPPWMAELNRDGRSRVAAGLGTEVVLANQEEFMNSCWKQVGEVIEANRLLNQARLALETARRLREKHLKPLTDQGLVALTAPLHDRALLGTRTVRAGIAVTSLPDAAVDAAMRRQASPRRPALRAVARRAGTGLRLGLVARLAAGDIAVDPNRFVPDGILTTAVIDAVKVPADATARVDLTRFGIGGEISAGEVTRARTVGRKVIESEGAGRLGLKLRSNLSATGIGTPQHVRALAEIQELAPFEATTTLGGIVATAETRTRALGFLVTPRAEGEVPRVEALDVTPGGDITLRTAAGRPNVELGHISPVLRGRAGGVAGVIAELPPGVLMRGGGAPVDISLDASGEPVVVSGGGGSRSGTVPALETASATITGFREAFRDLAVASGLEITPPKAELVAFDLRAARTALMARMDPEVVMRARVESMISVAGGRLAETVEGLFLTPVADRIMVAPTLPTPVYSYLTALDPGRFLPGVEVIPADSVTLLETNPRFVAAFLVGLNHEMNRELVWRGFPTDRRGTPFRRFWDRIDDADDIEPIHSWLGRAGLEKQMTVSTPQLVLLVRGELLRRYPRSIVYAVRATATGLSSDEGDIRRPVLGGTFSPDVTFVGFDLRDEDLDDGHGWYFVIQQPPTEPRFGLDASVPERRASIGSWSDVAWPDVGTAEGAHLTVAQLDAVPLGDIASSATAAAATLQRPARVAVHGRHLVTR